MAIKKKREREEEEKSRCSPLSVTNISSHFPRWQPHSLVFRLHIILLCRLVRTTQTQMHMWSQPANSQMHTLKHTLNYRSSHSVLERFSLSLIRTRSRVDSVNPQVSTAESYMLMGSGCGRPVRPPLFWLRLPADECIAMIHCSHMNPGRTCGLWTQCR